MNIRIPIIMFVCLMFFSACEKELMTEEEKKSNTEETTGEDADSKLTIVTRAPSGEVISYPVTVYIMNGEGHCVKKESLISSADELSVKLPAATYQVYAVGGATGTTYTLPSFADASANYEIALNQGASHADLMTASSSVTLERNGSNTLVMGFVRKVLKVNDITINDMPEAVSAVSVTLAPLYKAVQLDGTYVAGTISESVTIELTRQADGTSWKNASTPYLLPAVSAATVTVNIVTGNQSKSVTYTSSQTLAANSELNISGTYTGSSGEFVMSGVFTGAVWGDPTSINFTFNETSAEDAGSSQGGGGNSTSEGGAPAVNTWYKNCYVFKSVEDGNDIVVTLVHRNEVEISASGKTADQVESEINAALPGFNINGISGWRLMNAQEAHDVPIMLLNVDVENQGGTLMSNGAFYYYKDGDNLTSFLGNGMNRGYELGQYLRPVTTLHFNKQ